MKTIKLTVLTLVVLGFTSAFAGTGFNCEHKQKTGIAPTKNNKKIVANVLGNNTSNQTYRAAGKSSNGAR